jgi:Lon protease-like protein
MSATVTSPVFPPSALPDTLPIFPLAGAVLLPRSKLPLNVFEPRYLAMVEEALAHPGRMIGMVQPKEAEGQDAPEPTIYKIGCAGRVTSFTETEDGRYLITLTGICRFAVSEELPQERLFRRVKPDWTGFLKDIGDTDNAEIDHVKLLAVLKNYFKIHGIAADWEAVQSTPGDMLISSLAMICPLATNEKQALLEARDVTARAELLTALLEMASMPQADKEIGIRH